MQFNLNIWYNFFDFFTFISFLNDYFDRVPKIVYILGHKSYFCQLYNRLIHPEKSIAMLFAMKF